MGDNKNGIISLICGILGFFIPFVGLLLAIVAIIFGLKGRKEDDEPLLATIGLILGLIAVIISIIVIVMVISMFAVIGATMM